MQLLITLLISSLIAILCFQIPKRRQSKWPIGLSGWFPVADQSKLPPGPHGLPFFGNIFQAPSKAPWTFYHTLVRKYGNTVCLRYGSQNVIVVADQDVAKELLVRRKASSSDRPPSVMAGNLVCRGMHLLLSPHKDLEKRALVWAPLLSPRSSNHYKPIQDRESLQLLANLLKSNDPKKSLDIFTASVVNTLAYGRRIISGDEPEFITSQVCLENFTRAGQVGAWLVDVFPVLQYVPKPLAKFRRLADKWYEAWDDLHRSNMRNALNRKGWHWAKHFKQSNGSLEIDDHQDAWDLGTISDAGVETTSVLVQNFVLAWLAYPDFVFIAQNEIDLVVGQDRMPVFDDLKNLPYIERVVNEVFRWRHIVPAGIPHIMSKDEECRGYLFPRGSIIVPFLDGMYKDERLFQDPDKFLPGRWETTSGVPLYFGYGNRVCPGRFLAKNSISIVIARLLWAFKVSCKDGQKPVVTEDSFTTGFVSGPRSLNAVFKPRTDRHKEIIEASYKAMDKDVGKIMAEIKQEMDKKNVFKNTKKK